MSITNETAKAHANDPAVTCCRFEPGTVVEAANLEDPAIFPDLIDSGLLTIPDDALTIGQVMGATLTETLDALTPMTKNNVKGYAENSDGGSEEETEEVVDEPKAEVSQVAAPKASAGGVLKIYIAEGKDIKLEIPAVLLSE